MTTVAILGASGYTALELIEDSAAASAGADHGLTTRQEGSPPVHAIHQSLYGRLTVPVETLTPEQVGQAGGGCASAACRMWPAWAVPSLLAGGAKSST